MTDHTGLIAEARRWMKPKAGMDLTDETYAKLFELVTSLADALEAITRAQTALPEQGWLPIVLCPTDGKFRALKMPDGTEIVGCFDGEGPGPGRRLGATNRWKRREIAYHNPSRVIGQRGGVDQCSQAYDTYIDSDLPEGVYPTHFRPNDTAWGEPKLAAKIDPDGDDDGPVSPPPPVSNSPENEQVAREALEKIAAPAYGVQSSSRLRDIARAALAKMGGAKS